MASSAKKRTKDKASNAKKKRKLSESEEDLTEDGKKMPSFLTSKYAERPTSKIYNSHFRNNTPAEVNMLFRKDLISAMKMPDSEPLSPDEYVVIDDPWKPEWEKGVQVPVDPNALPEPTMRILRKREKIANFKLPKKLIRFTRDNFFNLDIHDMSYTNTLAERTCRYDMDDVDSQWLTMVNQDREDFGLQPLEENALEQIIEEFEVQAYVGFQEAIKSDEGLGHEYDEDAICDVCRSPDSQEENEMVFCDSCNICVHQVCYGITKIPEGSWICRTCTLGIRPACELCPNRGGAMKTTSQQKWAHVGCAVWMPEVNFHSFIKMEPIVGIPNIRSRRKALVCALCNEKTGVCIECCVPACNTAFHVTCAFKEGLNMNADLKNHEWNNDELKAYCKKHSKMKLKSTSESVLEEHAMGETEEQSEMLGVLTNEERANLRQKKIQEKEAEFYNYVDMDSVAENFQYDKCDIELIYNYWKLKRKGNWNRSLLPPKIDTENSCSMENSQFNFLKKLVHCRQDLERARNLCYMVIKREKLTSNWVQCKQTTFLKQANIMSKYSKKLSKSEMEAVCNAGYGDLAHDKKHAGIKSPNVSRVLNNLVGKHLTKVPLNGLLKSSKKIEKMKSERTPNPYAKHYLNGLQKRSQRWLATVDKQKLSKILNDKSKTEDKDRNGQLRLEADGQAVTCKDGDETSKDVALDSTSDHSCLDVLAVGNMQKHTFSSASSWGNVSQLFLDVEAESVDKCAETSLELKTCLETDSNLDQANDGKNADSQLPQSCIISEISETDNNNPECVETVHESSFQNEFNISDEMIILADPITQEVKIEIPDASSFTNDEIFPVHKHLLIMKPNKDVILNNQVEEEVKDEVSNAEYVASYTPVQQECIQELQDDINLNDEVILVNNETILMNDEIILVNEIQKEIKIESSEVNNVVNDNIKPNLLQKSSNTSSTTNNHSIQLKQELKIEIPDILISLPENDDNVARCLKNVLKRDKYLSKKQAQNSHSPKLHNKFSLLRKKLEEKRCSEKEIAKSEGKKELTKKSKELAGSKFKRKTSLQELLPEGERDILPKDTSSKKDSNNTIDQNTVLDGLKFKRKVSLQEMVYEDSVCSEREIMFNNTSSKKETNNSIDHNTPFDVKRLIVDSVVKITSVAVDKQAQLCDEPTSKKDAITALKDSNCIQNTTIMETNSDTKVLKGEKPVTTEKSKQGQQFSNSMCNKEKSSELMNCLSPLRTNSPTSVKIIENGTVKLNKFSPKHTASEKLMHLPKAPSGGLKLKSLNNPASLLSSVVNRPQAPSPSKCQEKTPPLNKSADGDVKEVLKGNCDILPPPPPPLKRDIFRGYRIPKKARSDKPEENSLDLKRGSSPLSPLPDFTTTVSGFHTTAKTSWRKLTPRTVPAIVPGAGNNNNVPVVPPPPPLANGNVESLSERLVIKLKKESSDLEAHRWKATDGSNHCWREPPPGLWIGEYPSNHGILHPPRFAPRPPRIWTNNIRNHHQYRPMRIGYGLPPPFT